MVEIKNQEAGYIAVARFLETKRNYYLMETISFNKQRYHMVKTRQGNVMIMFKREFFMSFGKIFSAEGETGAGETINCDDLKKAVQCDVKYVYFIYKNAHIYKIELANFLLNSYKRTADCEGKETRSVSIRHLIREGSMYE